jgi:hypothetical protein
MPLSRVIVGLGVNILTPLLGVTAFLLLCRKMQRADVQSPPIIAYFILFATFGSWLMVLLTVLFWEWSGMASLGILYLALISPLVTAGVAISLRNRRALSGFHRTAYLASIGYSGLILMGWLVCLGSWIFG